MIKNKLKNINWLEFVMQLLIVVISISILVGIFHKETKTELKEMKEINVALTEQNEMLETKLQDLTNEQIMFEIEQEEKNESYEVMFENQNAINESTNDLMEILIGF